MNIYNRKYWQDYILHLMDTKLLQTKEIKYLKTSPKKFGVINFETKCFDKIHKSGIYFVAKI